METVKILDADIDNLLESEVLEQLKSGVVFTPNVDHLILLQNDPEFLEVYDCADYRLCDSKILFFVSRFRSRTRHIFLFNSFFLSVFSLRTH